MKKDPNKICVLLVDDDPGIRDTMTLVLESMDFEVHTAIDGQDAIGKIAQAKVLPDLLITDMMMPNMTGWELIDVLNKISRTRTLPVIVYSGIAHYVADNKVLANMHVRFLRKPVELDLLEATIKECLAHPKRPTAQQGVD